MVAKAYSQVIITKYIKAYVYIIDYKKLMKVNEDKLYSLNSKIICCDIDHILWAHNQPTHLFLYKPFLSF